MLPQTYFARSSCRALVAQQAKMRDLEVAARQHFNSNQNERARRAKDEADREIGVLQTDSSMRSIMA